MRAIRLLGAPLAAALVVLVLASCTPEPTPVPTRKAVPAVLAKGDGILRIGTEFPTTGASAFIGPAQAAGVEVAVREINSAGGVLGKPVEVLHRDSGDAPTTVLETSFADLVSKKIDVLVGPSSSVLVERLVPKAVAAGVAMISPAATSPVLSTLNDSGLLFRTIPSDSLEGTALAGLVVKKKGTKVALVYFGDDSGKAINGALAKNVVKAGGTLVAAQQFDGTTKDLAGAVAAVAKAKPDAVVLASPFSAMEQNKALLTQLSAAGLGGAKLWLTSGDLADYSQALPAGLLTGVNGILEGAEPNAAFAARVKAADPAVTDIRYSAEAYDATILAALAATVAKNDSGAAVAAALPGVSSGGIKCLSYGECLDVLKTQNDIDYDGVSGPISFSAAGDPLIAHYGVYSYTAENQFVRTRGIVAG
ncbi:MAG: branched-chain amino acid transport system substrate-binding protein [Microbacteriaceae bacterium]|jgi:ABC-type branched-subunit amino acid transport system substrate-binding protein|nr:amino acid transporter substrate-binding protein [Microbacteriaceae bacterium]MDQ1526678.1 branched-chain amino acid transport system substrate-binding protein [Microbacteriaceae bacterium]